MSAKGRKRAEGPRTEVAEGIRLGRWEDTLADVRCDSVIVDAPYSERVHDGALQRPARIDNVERTPISYSCWGKAEVDAFVASWAPRTSCWMVSITDHLLMPLWLDAYDRAGLYSFAPVGVIITGMGCRIVGDGPSSWTLYACVARQRRKMAGGGIWRTLPGGYVGTQAGVVGGGHEGGGGRGKPSWLIEALVSDYSDPGMLVCDPCAGWGSTLVAALKLGRRAVGAEVDPEAFAIADRRVRGEESRPRAEQPSLFASLAGGG